MAFLGLAPRTEPVLTFPTAGAQEAPRAENKVEKNIRLLKSGDAKQRKQAAEMLGTIGNPGAFPGLMDALEDEDPKVRANAAEALGKIGDPGAIPGLIDMLRDLHGNVRISAAVALGIIRVNDQQFETILEMLTGDVLQEKWGAAVALGEIKDAKAVPALLEALKDEDKDVNELAAWALENIGKPAVPALIKALKDENPKVRFRAAWVLGSMREIMALPDLIILAENDPNETVRKTAQRAANLIEGK